MMRECRGWCLLVRVCGGGGVGGGGWKGGEARCRAWVLREVAVREECVGAVEGS